jgi:hypothetical protein
MFALLLAESNIPGGRNTHWMEVKCDMMGGYTKKRAILVIIIIIVVTALLALIHRGLA